MYRIVVFGLTTLLTLSLVTITNAEMSEKAKMGRELFSDPSFGGTLDPAKASGLSCSDCHADFDEATNPTVGYERDTVSSVYRTVARQRRYDYSGYFRAGCRWRRLLLSALSAEDSLR